MELKIQENKRVQDLKRAEKFRKIPSRSYGNFRRKPYSYMN